MKGNKQEKRRERDRHGQTEKGREIEKNSRSKRTDRQSKIEIFSKCLHQKLTFSMEER